MKYTFGTWVYLLPKTASTDFMWMIHDSLIYYLWFTELMNADCMLERDYQGWVDFGRREAKWLKPHRPGVMFVQVFYQLNVSMAESL